MRILLRVAVPNMVISFALSAGGEIRAGQEKLRPVQPAETAPSPRKVLPPIEMVPSPGGFQLALSRPMTVALRKSLDTAADEKTIARLLRDNAQLRREAGLEGAADAAKLELMAFVVSSQLPAFKKALHERMGANGVVIQVLGLQRERLFKRPRPILEAGLKIASRVVTETTPEEVGRTLEAVQAMARTTPLSWSVLPRE